MVKEVVIKEKKFVEDDEVEESFVKRQKIELVFDSGDQIMLFLFIFFKWEKEDYYDDVFFRRSRKVFLDSRLFKFKQDRRMLLRLLFNKFLFFFFGIVVV